MHLNGFMYQASSCCGGEVSHLTLRFPCNSNSGTLVANLGKFFGQNVNRNTCVLEQTIIMSPL